MAIAGALDLLAADVAAIKAKTSDIEWEAVQHFVESEKAWVKLVEEQRDAAIRERDQWREEARLAVINRDEARAEVERLRAELAARPAANSPKISDSSPAASQPAALAAGWLTEEERRRALSRAVHLLFDDDCDTPSPRTIQALLARAGSPPVVEVPELGFLGPMTGREQGIVLAYRDALDAAGVPWKEV